MAKKKMKTRMGVALLGVGAIAATSILPGAISLANSTGNIHTAVTRAVLAQGDVNGEINRATLVTQIQVDGNGQTSFSVPTVSGGSPKNMDSFGGPNVENGAAQYDLTVDGAQTIRTSQDFDPNDIPVTVDVSATLDGQSVQASDLVGKTGLATLTYTLTNHTTEPTQVTYQDAAGNSINREMEIPTPMAGAVSLNFDSTWTEVSSEQADAVAQNGQGGTQVGATVALMAGAAGSPVGAVTIEGRVQDAVVPPLDLKVAIIAPLDTTSGKSGEAQAQEIGSQMTTLYTGIDTAATGAQTLATGLAKAVSGAQDLANGEALLGAGMDEFFQKAVVGGHQTAKTAAETLVDTIRGQSSYTELLGGFDTINSPDGLFAVQDTLLQLGPALGYPFEPVKATSTGEPDLSTATIASGLSTVVFGMTKKSAGQDLPSAISGLTNPQCNPADPTNANNPCGAVQVLDLLGGGLGENVPAACKASLEACGTPPNNPGVAAMQGLIGAIAGDGGSSDDGYEGEIGADVFGTGKLLNGKSITNIINSMMTSGCKFKKVTTGSFEGSYTPGGDTTALGLCFLELAGLVSLSPARAQKIVEIFNIGIIQNQFAIGAELALDFVIVPGLEKIRKGLVDADNGWPDGCQGPSGDSNPALFHDKFECNMNASQLASALFVEKKFTASNILNALAILATKSDSNPGGQIPASSPLYDLVLQFGTCPGGAASQAEIKKHCSPVQIFTFLAAGISGDNKTTVSDGVVDPRCPTPTGSWIPPTNGSDTGTVPSPPPSSSVQRYGLACAVQVLQQSINKILLPSIGNGVQQNTLETIGTGQYSPDCDPSTNATLTCAVSQFEKALTKGDPNLVEGTAELADQLPAAEEGAAELGSGLSDQALPGINSGVESANETVAVLETLSQRAESGANIPGGAASGVSSNQGIYAFEFAGAGGPASNSLSRFILALLILIAAGGLGWFLATRNP